MEYLKSNNTFLFYFGQRMEASSDGAIHNELFSSSRCASRCATYAGSLRKRDTAFELQDKVYLK